MEQIQKLTFQQKCYKYVASPFGGDLPKHRITLRAEDETSCSTSHCDKFLLEMNALLQIYCKF